MPHVKFFSLNSQPLAGSDQKSLYATKQVMSDHLAGSGVNLLPLRKAFFRKDQGRFRSKPGMEQYFMSRKRRLLILILEDMKKFSMIMSGALFGFAIIGNDIVENATRDYRYLLGYALAALIASFVLAVATAFIAAVEPVERE